MLHGVVSLLHGHTKALHFRPFSAPSSVARFPALCAILAPGRVFILPRPVKEQGGPILAAVFRRVADPVRLWYNCAVVVDDARAAGLEMIKSRARVPFTRWPQSGIISVFSIRSPFILQGSGADTTGKGSRAVFSPFGAAIFILSRRSGIKPPLFVGAGFFFPAFCAIMSAGNRVLVSPAASVRSLSGRGYLHPAGDLL